MHAALRIFSGTRGGFRRGTSGGIRGVTRGSTMVVPKSQMILHYLYIYMLWFFLLKTGLCIKIDFYDNSWVPDFYDYKG